MSKRRPSLLLAIRLLLLLGASLSVVSAWMLARGRAEQQARGGQPHACPMHPEVQAGGPDPCAICGMALVPRREQATAARGTLLLPAGQAVPAAATSEQTVLNLDRQMSAPALIEDAGGGAMRVRALLYNDEAALLAPGQQASFRWLPRGERLGASATVTAVRLTAVPARSWDHSTTELVWERVGGAALSAATRGWLEIALGPRDNMVVPDAAVLVTPEGSHVLVVSGDGRRVVRRPVTTGRSFFGSTTVLGGLTTGDRVIARATALYETERRLLEPSPPAGAPAR